MHRVSHIKRTAVGAGMLLVPLVLLAIGLGVRLAAAGGSMSARPGALDISMDVDTAVRWLLAAGLLAIGGLAVAAALRRR